MLKDCESVSESVSEWVSEIIEYRAAASQLKKHIPTKKQQQSQYQKDPGTPCPPPLPRANRVKLQKKTSIENEI